jgi:excisionase family DNA binding protein
MLSNMDELLTPREVGRMLHLHYKTVQLKCKLGEIPAVKVFDRWRIPRSYVDDYTSRLPDSQRDTG